MRLRKLTKMTTVNDGSRSLVESIMAPEVICVLGDWMKSTSFDAVLIGDLALCYHAKPRMTDDISFLVRKPSDIPQTAGSFKPAGPGAFRHNKTGIEVEVITSINVPQNVIDRVFDTAVVNCGVKIANASGLVALKLFRSSMQDRADIVALIKTSRVALTDFPLGSDRLSMFDELAAQANAESD
ncbi:MAG: hypothetical protein ACLQJR_03300 [Stellaceae bacterium]